MQIYKKQHKYTPFAAVLSLVLCFCFLFTACTPAANSTPPPAPSQQSADVNAEKPSTVRINIGSEPDSLDPWQSAATDTEAIMHNVFDGLLLYNPKGEIIPGLAEKWEISEDGLTYTFYLRKDVLFHNGQKFTSADVKYTYENLSGMNGEKAISSKFTSIAKIETPDDYTFIVTLAEKSAPFLAFNIVPILPQGYTQQETNPVGAGPFKFVKYVPGQKIVLERFDEYYNKDRLPEFKTAEVYIMTDNSAVVSALRSGQLDIASVTASDAAMLSTEYTIYDSPQNMVQIMALNNSVKPFDDVRVRQAINYLVNKQEIIDGVFGGYGTQLYSNFSPVMALYYNNELNNLYKQDIEKAKELLKEAGYENGFDITITVPANYQKHIDSAQIIVEQLKQGGINATIETIEWAAWLEDVYSNAQYQTTIIGLTGKLDPNDVLGRYSSTYAKNFFKYSNPRYDELIKEALVQTDEAERVKLYKECQKLLAEEAAAVYISDPNLTIAARTDLKGYTFYPVGFIDFCTLYYA